MSSRTTLATDRQYSDSERAVLRGPMLEATRALTLGRLGAFGFVKPTIRYSRRIGPKRATP